MLQSLVSKVSDDGDTVPSAVSVLATPSTTSPVGSLSSFTVKVAVPPSSVVPSREVVDVDGDTANPAVSSSVKVSVTFGGAATPLPPATVPETVTGLSATSTSLSFAVTVTAPALAVSPAAMVSVVVPDSAKSAAIAPVPGAAPTVTVTASLDAPDSAAVTVDTPLLSEIDAGDRTSITVGSVSSSVSVSVRLDGAATPLPPDAVPETVTCLFGESTAFPFAVTVTAPALAVSPAAIVSVFALDSVKSAGIAPVPAAAPTVTVTASLDAPNSVAVTVETPLLSEIDIGDSANVTVGNASSSLIVSVASGGARTSPLAAADTLTRLFGASIVLLTAVTVTVPVLAVPPVAKVSVAAADSVKSPAGTDTVSVAAESAALSSVAVTVETPPLSEIDDGDSESVAFGSATMGNHSVLK